MSSGGSRTGEDEYPDPEDDGDESILGTIVADRYRVDEKLGEGGMGAVYRAEHVLMQKPVAIKILHREMTALEEIVKRFEREAIAAGRIDHPNVAVATDFGKLSNGSFFLVLEYVPGRSLTDLLRVEKALDEERALSIARQIASALAAAHAAGIVHRDLKPDNVMLIEKGGYPDFVKVLDFGIAKLESSGSTQQLTRLGSVFGTPQYMSPEQAAGKNVDARSDLYALGLLMYEMLAGRPAFEAAEIIALLTKQMTEMPEPLPDRVPPEVAAIVMKLLQKEPSARHQSADEVVAVIDELLGPAALVPESGASATAARTAPSVVAGTDEPASTSPRLSSLHRIGKLPLVATLGEALSDSVTVRDKRIPLWALGAAMGGVLMLVLLLSAVLSGGPAAGGASATAAVTAPPPPDLARTFALAAVGNAEAMRTIEAMSESERTGAAWLALGKGRLATGQRVAALDAFEKAAAEDPRAAEDEDLLGAVRTAADDDTLRQRALAFAADGLGAAGADLLFDVWASTSAITPATEEAKALLDRPAVREKASKALAVALALRETKKCDEMKALLAEAVESGDVRSLRPLQKLQSTSGCGFLGLGDCFPCLRRGTLLKDAIGAVEVRGAPGF